jgi:hypothetical protein
MIRLARVAAVLMVSVAAIGAAPTLAQQKLDYTTPSVEAHATMVAVSEACKAGVTSQLNAAKGKLKSLAIKDGWSSARFDATYKAAYAQAVRDFASSTPVKREKACAQLEAMREGKMR